MSNLIRKQSDCIKAAFIHSKAVIPPLPPQKQFFCTFLWNGFCNVNASKVKSFHRPKKIFICFTVEEGAKFFKNKNKLVKATAVDSRQIVN